MPTAHFKYTQFIACQLYLNKAVKNGKRMGGSKEGRKEEEKKGGKKGKEKLNSVVCWSLLARFPAALPKPACSDVKLAV